MYKIKIVIIALTLFSACGNHTQTEGQHKEEQKANLPKSCYLFNDGRDSIKMTIEISNSKAKGDLDFFYNEKDHNSGSFIGEVKGDTLWGKYNYKSEGIESSREIVFLRKGNGWIQGYGEITEKDGGFVFTDNAEIRFDHNFTLEEVACNP